MFKIRSEKKIQKEEFKSILFKKMFNSSVNSKRVRRSARKSSEDQKKLIERYHRLFSS